MAESGGCGETLLGSGSFWQLTSIALLAWLLDRALQRRSASVRYRSLLLSLLVMMASPVVTWMMLPTSMVEDVAAVSDADLASGLMQEILLPATNTEPNSPIEEIHTSAAVHQESPNQTSASISLLMNRCAEFLKPWLGMLVAVWCAGVLMFSIRPVLSWVNVQRLKRQGISAVSDSVRHMLTMIRTKLQVHRRVDVMMSTVVSSPIVVGCLRSVILIPASFIASIPPEQLEAILAHELAHVKRYDYFVNLMQTLLETLFFYHPAFWWLSHRIRIERENCCDDMVVAALNNKVDYGRALLAIEEYRGQISTLAIGAKGGSLVARVRRLFSDPVYDGSQTTASLLSLGTLLFVVLMTTLWSHAVASDETSVAREESNTIDNEPPRALFENGKSVSFIGIRANGASNDSWWSPNGKGSVSSENRWSPSSMDWGLKGRDFLFSFSGFGRTPSLRVMTPSLCQENYVNYEDQTIQQSDRLLDYSRISDVTQLVEPTTAKVWITDETWGKWLRVKADGEILNPIDISDAFNHFYRSIEFHKVTDASALTLPSISLTLPKHYSNVGDFQFRAISSNDTEIDCRCKFTETGSVYTVREMPNAGQFSHFEFRLRPFRYLATFCNIVADGPTDKPSEVRVEVTKLNDTEILASLTVNSVQESEH